MPEMNKFALFSLVPAFLVSPLAAQQEVVPVVQMLQEAGQSEAPASLRLRSRAFSALGAIPAEVDSFVAIAQLGKLFRMADAELAGPYAELLEELDSLAFGVPDEAVRDWSRFLPLCQLFASGEDGFLEEWRGKAAPAPARAIVARQRESREQLGAQLVELTKDCQLAPIYMVLTSKPGSERLLHQLSVLPLLLPVNPDGSVELVGRGGWRGFCLRWDALDFRDLYLSPEHEDQLKTNLQNARLYLVCQVVANKLVMVLCSNLDDVQLPARISKSLLASEQMRHFDGCMKERPWAVSFSSAESVKMQEKMHAEYLLQIVQDFSYVFNRLTEQGDDYAKPFKASEDLLKLMSENLPMNRSVEQFMVWQKKDAKDQSIYVRFKGGAVGGQYEPGVLSYSSCAQLPGTAVYFESTPVKHTSKVNLAEVLKLVDTVRDGYYASFTQPGTPEGDLPAQVDSSTYWYDKLYPAAVKLAEAEPLLHSALTGSAAMLVQESTGDDKRPLSFSAVAGVADEAAMDAAASMVSEGMKMLEQEGVNPFKDYPVDVLRRSGEVVLSCGQNAFAAPAPQVGIPVEGGAVFSINFATLARVMNTPEELTRNQAAEETADALHDLAKSIESVQGYVTTLGDQVQMQLKIQPVQQHDKQQQ